MLLSKNFTKDVELLKSLGLKFDRLTELQMITIHADCLYKRRVDRATRRDLNNTVKERAILASNGIILLFEGRTAIEEVIAITGELYFEFEYC